MLTVIKATLVLSESFDACVWAMASCAFFSMMRFGEVSVASRSAFSPSKHLTSKTARAGETQSIFLNEQGDLCPLAALRNLVSVVPALADDPLFSWHDAKGEVHPMVKVRAMERINSILMGCGWGTSFGHSFRIGGASFYLAKKVDPEIV
ncbi:uncharacterized protein EDB91DRAFT_1344735 [Suillus paluster]|uniref:uncharacterized protein n=1 Tax=Suillus paluster TaxID=48578 RepID=UPI001B85CAC4|nr:uncharacterized protein EDB91DRAFT_1344735 [Suillus paluster]KAG1749061.1 hypothetical protein EDB91DRAFT_1344735 [Suillus paluster]